MVLGPVIDFAKTEYESFRGIPLTSPIAGSGQSYSKPNPAQTPIFLRAANSTYESYELLFEIICIGFGR